MNNIAFFIFFICGNRVLNNDEVMKKNIPLVCLFEFSSQ